MAMAARSRARSLISKPFLSSLVAPRTPLLRHRPLAAALASASAAPALPAASRCFSSRPTSSSLNDPSPNWSNRPPKETILLDGCDFEHWLVVMEPPEGTPTRDEIIDSYIKTLAQVVGSEDEARMKVYSVSTRHYFAFGALVSEELSYEIKKLPKVRWVLPDSYLDVKNKDYGGEPFINGQAVPYDPKYHEEWVRNNARANERSRRNDRPRNFDRSRNFERRRENMQNRDFQNTTPQPPFPQNPGTPQPPFPQNPGTPQPPFPQNPGTPQPPFPQNPGTPQPPFPQNPGPPSASPSMPNAQTAPPMPNAQAIPRSPFSQNPGPGSSGFQNQGMHPPNSNIPNSGFQNQGMPPPNSSIPNSGFQNPPGGGLGGPNYQNHGNSGYPNHGAYQNQGGYPNQGPGYQNQGAGGGLQNQGNFPNQGNYQNPGPYQNQGTGGPPPNRVFQNSYAPNRDMGDNPNANAYQGQDLPGRAAPTMPGRDY